LGAADVSMDVQIVATLDWWYATAQGAGGSGNVLFFGAPDVEPIGANPAVMVSSGGVSPGEFVTIPVVGYDPAALSYEVGEQIQILTTSTAELAVGETTVITAIGAADVQVRQLQFGYAAGARLGARPCRITRVAQSQVDIVVTATDLTYFSSPVRLGRLHAVGGDVLASLGLGAVAAVQDIRVEYPYAVSKAGATTELGFGSQAATMARQPYFLPRGLTLVRQAADDRSVLGELPGLLDYPGSVTYYTPRHDNFRDPQVTAPTPNDYVPVRGTSTSIRHFLMGPTPRT